MMTLRLDLMFGKTQTPLYAQEVIVGTRENVLTDLQPCWCM